MSNTQIALIGYAFAWVPYLLVAWAYTAYTDGGAKTFWIALAVLVGVRAFFGIIETLGSILTWRLFGKKVMVQRMFEILRANDFPKRKYSSDDLGNYLARIADGDEEVPPKVQTAAKEMNWVLLAFEQRGILEGMRMRAATEAALDIYSPKRDAPPFTYD